MRSLRFHIPTAPISQQSSGAAKGDLRATIRSVISGTKFFLTGEVRLNIDWMVHDRIRYETDKAPDVDNILKPTIDALTGPAGIMFDDCQVQRVSCGWIDIPDDDQAFEIELEYFEDEVISSRDIIFVRFDNGLCFPFRKELPKEVFSGLVTHLVERLRSRQQIQAQTGDYYTSLYIMPIQRFFHRSRIQGFDVIDHKAVVKQDASSGESG